MKRLATITIFFAAILGVMFLASCNETIEVERSSCGETETVTLSGCTVTKDCTFDGETDTYKWCWFPLALGCYESDMSCSCSPTPSCVVFGIDLTLLECYGKSYAFSNGTPDEDDREVITAVEGVHYTIDKTTVTVNSNMTEFDDGFSTREDLYKLLDLLRLEEAEKVQFCIEFTAITELQSASMSASFDYSFGTNHVYGFNKKIGNDGTTLKSKNLQPGKHVISVNVSFDAADLLTLESISDISFTAFAYED